VYKGIKTHLMV